MALPDHQTKHSASPRPLRAHLAISAAGLIVALFAAGCSSGHTHSSINNLPEASLVAPGAAKSHVYRQKGDSGTPLFSSGNPPATGIDAVTNSSIADVVNFYKAHLAKSGWTISADGPRLPGSEFVRTVDFSKGSMSLDLEFEDPSTLPPDSPYRGYPTFYKTVIQSRT